MGVFIKNGNKFDKSLIGDLNRGYEYFDSNRDLYINSIALKKEGLFDKLKK